MPLGGVCSGKHSDGEVGLVLPLPEDAIPEFIKSCESCGLPKHGEHKAKPLPLCRRQTPRRFLVR